MATEKIEAFWENATADDVARVMKGEAVEARFRDSQGVKWVEKGCSLAGWSAGEWTSSSGLPWNHCQVYREPSWWTDRPDPGPGYRLLGKSPDEELNPGDEAWNMWLDGKWGESDFAREGKPQQEKTWYRRRIDSVEPKFAVGQTVRVTGPRSRMPTNWDPKMDFFVGMAYAIVSVRSYSNPTSGTTNFYSVGGISNWAFREDYLEPVEPEPQHYVLRVGDTCETPCGNRTVVTPQGSPQKFLNVKAGDTIKTIHGQTITITEKGFEVTQ
jgi:hypothetical protein